MLLFTAVILIALGVSKGSQLFRGDAEVEYFFDEDHFGRPATLEVLFKKNGSVERRSKLNFKNGLPEKAKHTISVTGGNYLVEMDLSFDDEDKNNVGGAGAIRVSREVEIQPGDRLSFFVR